MTTRPFQRMRIPRHPIERVALHVGDRVQFTDEHLRVRWTVKAVSVCGRFAILTKPFNLRRTVLYTVADFDAGVRGPDDRVFGPGYETDEQIARALAMFEAGDAEVSVRHDVPLDIAEVNGAPPTSTPVRHLNGASNV